MFRFLRRIPLPCQLGRSPPGRVVSVRCFAEAAAAAVGRNPSPSSAPPVSDEYSKRNYADNVAEYNTVLASLIGMRRFYLLRDVYDDMMLDGVQPIRDTFHSLIVGSMKGSRLQDAFYYRDQMKTMGMLPDVALYNYLISVCGKCKNSDMAVNLLEEMKACEVKPNGQTYICLLNAFASTGRTDRVYAIVRDMTAAGLGLNKFCYAGLITAHKNKASSSGDINAKIVELVKQSKGWTSIETPSDTAENVMMGVSEEELYNLPTADFTYRRGFLNRRLAVYHVATHACADLRSVETLETILEMLKQDVPNSDTFIVIQTMRCYLNCGDVDQGLRVFNDYLASKPPSIELYVTLALGAMQGNTPKGMQVAQETLEKMNSRGFFLNPRYGNELLLAASREQTGGFTTANFVWDLMQNRKISPSLEAVQAYLTGLRRREIPPDDPRLLLVTRVFDNARARVGPRSPSFLN